MLIQFHGIKKHEYEFLFDTNKIELAFYFEIKTNSNKLKNRLPLYFAITKLTVPNNF